MNVSNFDLLDQLQDQTLEDGRHRFVLFGSLGRAAILETPAKALYSADKYRFQDVDAIDQRGMLTAKYHFLDGSILDLGVAAAFRPVDDSNERWGAYDPLSGADKDEPVVTFSSSSLGLRATHALHKEIAVTTPDACGHLGMLAICRVALGPMSKHFDQISELQKRRDELCSGCNRDEMEAVVTEYQAVMHERLKARPLPLYTRFRRQVFTRVPELAQLTMDRKAGSVLRRLRGSEPLMRPIENLEALLSTTPVSSRASSYK